MRAAAAAAPGAPPFRVRCLPRMLGVGGVLPEAGNRMRLVDFDASPVALAV